MLFDFTFYYIIANIFCILLLLIVLEADRMIEDRTPQSRWFKATVILFMVYFAIDTAWCAVFTEVLPRNQLTVTAVNIFLSLFLGAVSYSLFIYVALRLQYHFLDDKKNKIRFVLPAVILFLTVALPLLFDHEWICGEDGRLTLQFNLLFLMTPVIYSVTAVALALFRAVKTKDADERTIAVTLAIYPFLMLLAGGIEILVEEAPLFCYSATLGVIFIYITFTIRRMTTDILTGLRHKEGLPGFLRRLSSDKTYAALMIDVNGLKMVNDIYGHIEGDISLRIVSRSLAGMMYDRRKEGLDGFACRFGGDEFFSILEVTSVNEIPELEKELRSRIAGLAAEKKTRDVPQISVGAARADLSRRGIQEIIRKADERMYSQKRRMEEPARDIDLFKDDVTGLPNANYFHNLAGTSLTKMVKEGRIPVVIFFDVYGMHVYNDRFGFAEGNNLLKITGDAISEEFPGELVIRYTDDHFIAVTSRQDVEKAVTDIDRRIAAESIDRMGGIRAGVYFCRDAGVDEMSALDRARQAKNFIGTNHNQCCCIYDESIAAFYSNKDYIVGHFDEALRNGWIVPYFQPHVGLSNGKICGSEALARWIDPNRGILNPSAFVPVLEETHQIWKMDLEIIRQVCSRLHEYAASGSRMLPVSVNLSGIDFLTGDIFGEIEKIRKEYRISPDYLKIEITESTLTAAPERLKQTMAHFRDAGYEIWMDDFGSDFSSLGTLKDYDFDLIKIDMGFLQDFDKNEKSAVILRSIVGMADALGLKTLCEGVETRQQYDFLKKIGCGKVQGYLISKPVPNEQMIKLMKTAGKEHDEGSGEAGTL